MTCPIKPPVKAILWAPDANERRLATLLQLAGPALEELRQRWVINQDAGARDLFMTATGLEPQLRKLSNQPEYTR